MKQLETYSFFFDESSHDRKVTNTEKGINIYIEGNNDLFVGVFWGINSQFEDEYRHRYLDFDKFGKDLLGLSEDKELKGTTIRKSNFKSGISSFNKNTVDIYNRFFDLIDNNIILHITLYSKTEFLITNYFTSIIFPRDIIISKRAFIYSIIKFLFNYRRIELLEKIFSTEALSTKEFLIELMTMLEEVISKIKNVKRKKFELSALSELLLILRLSDINSSAQEKFEWDYQIIFDGFKLLLAELKINPKRVNLVLDQEGTGKILNTANIQGFNNVIELDSEIDPCVRISDFLSNFINRLSLAMYDSLKEQKFDDPESFDYESKHLLNTEWFDFKTDKQFLLYKKIHKILSERKNIYWTSYCGIYFDYQIILFSLINYIGEHKDLNSFKKYSPEIHVEHFNTYCAQKFQQKFLQFK
ncbi:hypothetical protein [Cytobacillus praedii]|uniref:hypothetical protein n=1 Tax=Cytobacillus praedii TaxID=1742358 RepID=UPI002E1CAE13|nr:hypothetical protein [Cytobacillus praedii]